MVFLGWGDAQHTPERLHHSERYWQLQKIIFGENINVCFSEEYLNEEILS
jgi:hypothetical protein